MSTTIWGDWTQEVAWGRFDMGTSLIELMNRVETKLAMH